MPELNHMSELSEKRLWKTLDDIQTRLSNIGDQLSDLVRLEERMKQHDNLITRHSNRLDGHENRIRENEIWQANHGEANRAENLLANFQNDVKSLFERIEQLEKVRAREKGSKDVMLSILKWIFAILSGILIYKLTKG